MNYELKDVASFITYSESKQGLRIDCPNCATPHAAWFRNPIGGSSMMTNRPLWDRTGETLESMSLTPSFLAYNCYHSWIRNGQLCIDSPFSCQRKTKMENENTASETQQEAPAVEQEQAQQEAPAEDSNEVVCVTCGAHYSKGDTACPNISNHQ